MIASILKQKPAFIERRLDQDIVAPLRAWVTERSVLVKPSTVNRELNLVSTVFTYAMKQLGIRLQVNPVSQIQRPRANQKGRERVWTQQEIQLLRAAANASGVQSEQVVKVVDFVLPAVELAVETAMRLGEICRILVSQTNLQMRFIRLGDTKNGDSRIVPLSARAVELLRPLLDRAVATEQDEVFPVSPQSLGVEFRKLRNKAGLQGLRFHDTRHTAATRMAEKLPNILELSAVTGHRDPRSLKRYYHPDPALLAAKLDS